MDCKEKADSMVRRNETECEASVQIHELRQSGALSALDFLMSRELTARSSSGPHCTMLSGTSPLKRLWSPEADYADIDTGWQSCSPASLPKVDAFVLQDMFMTMRTSQVLRGFPHACKLTNNGHCG